MYDWHNYGRDVIGARSDVENVDIGRLQAFYRLYYQPDNATLIVAGSFDSARVLRRVAASFGAIPKPRRTLPSQYTLDPAQDGQRSVMLRRVGGAPLVFAGYHVPPAGIPMRRPDLLARSSSATRPRAACRYKRLTEKQLAASTFGESFGLAEPSVLLLGAQLPPGADPQPAARAAMLETIESFASEPVSEAEAARPRQWLKNWEQTFNNPEAVGMVLSGRWRRATGACSSSRATACDASWPTCSAWPCSALIPDNRTAATYPPPPTSRSARRAAAHRHGAGDEGLRSRPRRRPRAEAFAATPANIDATQRFEIGGLKAAVVAKATPGQAVRSRC